MTEPNDWERQGMGMMKTAKPNRGWINRLLVVSALSCAWAGESTAATRTVQFVGSGINHTSKIRLDQFRDATACTLVIVNSGSSSQRIQSANFYSFTGTNGELQNIDAVALAGMDNPLVDAAIFNSGSSSSSSPTCSNSGCAATSWRVESGGFFVAVAYVDFAAFSGKSINLCSGYFQVDDVDPAQPGSMVATGSISYVSELGITGGQFNGAMYLSGSHVGGTARVASNQIFEDAVSSPASLPAFEETMQMNLYCSQACQESILATSGSLVSSEQVNFCQAACGIQAENAAAYEYTNDSTDRTRNLFGFLEETTPMDFGASKTLHIPNEGEMRAMQRTANPHWAGGYVVEMIVGPFNSICSGNEAFFAEENNNTDFSHIDTIDDDPGLRLASPGDPSKGPPERLFCSHTHMKDNPFGYVTSAVQFSINGGMPF